ncbi:restriction endonuclease subunit S [Aeromonas veronii]
MCSEWPLIPLRDFVDLLAGFAFKSTGYSDGQDDVRLLRGDNIAPGRVRWDGVKRWSRENAVGLERYALEPGDVVLAMDRPWIPAGLKVAQVQAADTPSYLVQRVARIRPASREDCSFLFALLSTPEFESYIQNVTTGTAVPHISAKQILDFEFRLPPAYVRAKVGEIVAALNERITLLRETNTTLEAMAQALFKSWFVDFDPVHARARGEQPAGLAPEVAALFPDSFEESKPGMVPKGWSWSVLGNVCTDHGGTIQTGPFGSQLHASDYVQEGTPVVMPKDISGRRVDGGTAARIGMADVERLSRHQLQIGDIVFSRRGDVEKHALISELEQGWLCGTGCLLVRPGKNWSSPGFLSRLLDLQSTKRWLTQHAVGATMPNLNTGILAAVPVLLPSREVLMEFEQLTHVLDTRISENNATIQTLANLRDTLLPRLISGQLRLPDAEAMVSEAQA